MVNNAILTNIKRSVIVETFRVQSEFFHITPVMRIDQPKERDA